MLTNLTLWKKITLLTAIGLLLGVGVFSSVAMRAVNKATETTLEERLTTARLVALYMDEALGRALTELENTSKMITTDVTKTNFEYQINTLETTYSRLSIFTNGTFLLNENGEMIWSTLKITEVAGSDVFSHPIISQAVNNGEASISGLVSVPMIGAPVVLLNSPTNMNGQGNRGVLVVAINVAQSSIGGFIQPIRLGETGYVEIVDQNGIVVTRTEPGPELAPFEKSDHSGRFSELIKAAKPTRGVCHTCHEPEQRVQRKDVLAFIPLTKTNWGVVIRQSEEEALAPVYMLSQNLILFGVGLGIIALLLVVITTRDIGGRIRTLTAASQKIAEGDLISPVTTSGKDEVGTLAQTLDQMRVRLRTSYGELEQKTKELSSLLSVSEVLTSSLDLPYLLDAVVAKAVEVVPIADGGILIMEDAAYGGVKLQCAIGMDEDTLAKLTSKFGSSFSSDFILKTVGNAENDMLKKTVIAFLQSDALHFRERNTICADVIHRNRHIGILALVSFRDDGAFSESDRRLLQAIADYVCIAIEKAQLTKEADEARALYEADRLRSQFISSISHELRTPLTLIKGSATSLLRQNVSWDEETQREFLQVIDEKTDELRDLIDKLLLSAKLEAGALKLEKEPLLLSHLTRRIVEEIEPRVRRHKFTLNFSPLLPVIEADVRCMEQVLRNLIENAVKYSPDGGKVIIAGEVKDRKILVSVTDEGIGIPPQHWDKVFERFYRIDSHFTNSTPGSGLGLSIVRGHIEAHGGKVWLESKVRKGSKFCFSLPLDQFENEQSKSEQDTTDGKKNVDSIS